MIKNIQTLWLMVYFWSINPVLFVLTLDRSVLLEHFKFSYFFKAFHVGSVFTNYGRKDDSTNTHFKKNIPRIFLSKRSIRNYSVFIILGKLEF